MKDYFSERIDFHGYNLDGAIESAVIEGMIEDINDVIGREWYPDYEIFISDYILNPFWPPLKDTPETEQVGMYSEIISRQIKDNPLLARNRRLW